jgi:hypothetical protein
LSLTILTLFAASIKAKKLEKSIQSENMELSKWAFIQKISSSPKTSEPISISKIPAFSTDWI